jgi:hypothetical protein
MRCSCQHRNVRDDEDLCLQNSTQATADLMMILLSFATACERQPGAAQARRPPGCGAEHA